MSEPSHPDPAIVTLDNYEIEWAKLVGFYRFSESERDGKTQSDGSNDANGLRNHQQGAAAELALTKFLGMKWNATVNTYNNFPDLDGYLECRSKQDRQHYMRLYPRRDRAKGAAIFVSVTSLDSNLSTFRVDGWTLGSETMIPKYLKKNNWGREEWQLPLSELQPISTLRTETALRLSVVSRGRDKLRVWVNETLAKELAE
ncbi:MAG TPA: hypothetical protein VK578_24030 [Edaphobacter sp.]|nr:hypothetical protein [Edaphobacter sp.]